MFYGGHDYQLGRDRIEQMRTEVQQNRLEASLTRDDRLQKTGHAHRSMVARGTALIATLLR